jgi:hypothetical protein
VSRLFIGTPVYGGLCTDYTLSMLNSVPRLEQAGFQVEWKVLEGCCYVHTARNKLVKQFLVSGCDEMVFLDSDLGWDAEQFVKLCKRQKDIVGGAAPFRSGAGGFPVHPMVDEERRPIVDSETGLVRVDVLPTAIMKIKRKVFLDLAKTGHAPLRKEFNQDGKERDRFLSFFDFEVDEENHLEFGEDVTFCRKWTSLRGEIWVDPDMTIRHHGMSFREGNLHDYLRALPGGGGEAPKEWKFNPRSSAA